MSTVEGEKGFRLVKVTGKMSKALGPEQIKLYRRASKLIATTAVVIGGVEYLWLMEPFQYKRPVKPEPKLCRVKDLPIYTPAVVAQPVTTTSYVSPVGRLRENLSSNISGVREQIWAAEESYQKRKERAGEIWETSKAHTAGLIDTLQESGTETKAAVIAGGGLFGILLGIRGGRIKKSVYGTTVALGTAAFLYPQQSKELVMPYYNQAFKFVKDTTKEIIKSISSKG